MRFVSLLLFGCSGGSRPPAESGGSDDSARDDSAVDSRPPPDSDDSGLPDSNPPDSGDSATPVPEECTATPGTYCAACDAEVVIECPDDEFADWGVRVGATDAGAWLVTGSADRAYVFDVDPGGATPRDGVPTSFAKSAVFVVEDAAGALHLAASDDDWRIHYARPDEKGWSVESFPDDDTYLTGMTTEDGLPVLWFTDTLGKMQFARLDPKVSIGDSTMPDAYNIDWADLTLDTSGALVAGGFDERSDYSAVGLIGGEVLSLADHGYGQRPWAFARLPPSGSVEGSRLGVALMEGGFAVSFFDPELASTTVVETSELISACPDAGDTKPCPDDCHYEWTGAYSDPQFVAARDESGAVWVAYAHAHFDYDYHYEWKESGTHHGNTWSGCWGEKVNDESTFSYEVARVDEKGTVRPVLSIPFELGTIPWSGSVPRFNDSLSNLDLSVRNGRGVLAATYHLVDGNLVRVMMFDAE